MSIPMGETVSRRRRLEGLAQQNDMTLHLDYVGRGMYNRKCIGVSGTFSQFYNFVLDLAWENPEDFHMEEAPRSDNLGHDTIWYWPSATVEKLEGE